MTEPQETPSSMVHIFGVLLIIVVGVVVRVIYQAYMLSGSPSSSQWQLGLGLAGGAGVVLLLVFALRRRLRLGAAKGFEPWMITHAYCGVAAGIVLLHHGLFNFAMDLRGILLLLLTLSLLLGILLLILRKQEGATGPSAMTRRLSSLHLLVSIFTGILLVVHVLFDAVVHQ
ncbi:MAG: hypothetical protein LAO31_22815 [Acidobacteriia bacterium]|nr:hypothetical protein [Terriglobia bacterium]